MTTTAEGAAAITAGAPGAAGAAGAAAPVTLTQEQHTAALAEAVAAEAAKYKAPDKYESFKFPEGYTPQETLVGEFSTLAKNIGLKQDGAQQLVDFFGKMNAAQTAAAASEGEALLTKWKADAKADPTIGGANFEKNLGLVSKVLDKYGSPELKQFLTQSGVGDNPLLLRAFLNVANAIGEDNLVTGGGGTGGTDARKPEDVMYKPMQL